MIKDGTAVIKTGVPIFPRLDVDIEVAYIREQMQGSVQTPQEEEKEEEPQAEEISIDDFFKVDLRVATVLSCEAVPKADKLLKLQLDMGYEKRQVISGIAQYYKPEDVIGKKVIVVANLKPVKLKRRVISRNDSCR